MYRTLILLGCVVVLQVLGGCYFPNYYRVSFPDGVVGQIPERLFADSQTLLALPCWRWIKYSRYGSGPPVVLPVSSLDRLAQDVTKWRGFEMVDVFGHEGTEAPKSCGVFVVADNGRAFRVDYEYVSPRETPDKKSRWIWTNEVIAAVGPRIKADLVQALAGHPVSSESLQRLFGRAHGQVLGTPEDLAKAKEFVEQLNAGGDDLWRTPLQSAPDSSSGGFVQ